MNLLVRMLTVVGLCGCYSSYRLEDAPDLGVDATDAGLDLGCGVDCEDSGGPDVRDAGPDVMVFIPPPRPRTARCDLSDPPVFAGEAPTTCARSGGDADGDGFSDAIDCNDCSPQVNPGAYDFPRNGVDEDCDGRVDEAPCSADGLPRGPAGADALATALGLCPASERGAGLLSTRLTLADGEGEPDRIQAAVLDRLGVVGPNTDRPLVSLSNGVATETSRFGDRCFEVTASTTSRSPLDLSSGDASCLGVSLGAPVFDSVSLELRLRVPTNAAGFRIGANFLTREYPEFVCSPFNDYMVLLRELPDGSLENLMFDEGGNPMSVNNGLFEACQPGSHGGRDFDCPLGIGPLIGTGFDVTCGPGSTRTAAGGGTDWVCTDVATTAGQELTLRFVIWDSGDAAYSSLALFDGFAWLPAPFVSTE